MFDDIKSRLEKATKGPWTVSNCSVFALHRELPSMQLIAKCENIGASYESIGPFVSPGYLLGCELARKRFQIGVSDER